MKEMSPSSEANVNHLRQRILSLLREEGVESDELRALLCEWYSAETLKIENPNEPAGQIELIVRRARLFREGGLEGEARRDFEDALSYAWNMGMDQVCEDIKKEMSG